MITKTFDNSDEWITARKSAITGSKLGKMFSKRDQSYLTEFYQLIAERVALPPTEESAMDRGHRLEDEAMTRFEEETGHKVDKSLIMWVREDNEHIAISPDGVIDKENAVEVKCLSTAKHIEAWITKKVPSEYDLQAVQYFIVNDDLQTLYFVMYDPRCPVDMFYFEIEREKLEDRIALYRDLEEKALRDVEAWEGQITF